MVDAIGRFANLNLVHPDVKFRSVLLRPRVSEEKTDINYMGHAYELNWCTADVYAVVLGVSFYYVTGCRVTIIN